ncbi:MAG: phasin family protein [Alphaproteobacteria bacterium]|nr:phasin family protein [Alphaproteobacteria bacterium]
MANATNGAKNGFFDVTKVMSDFRMPGIDFEAVAASQRKNIEALTQANQLAVEGAQAVVRRQVEIARQAMEEFSTMFRDFVQPNGSPEDRLAKQAEYSKQALEKGLSNARELTELMTKANTEAFNVLNKRVTEGLDEVRDFAKKRVAAR